MTALVTFDFHNTIADCDEWFFLEIRDLPVRVIEELEPNALTRHSAGAVTATYRELRKAVMESGKEIDALEGVMRVAAALEISLDRQDAEQCIERLMREASEHATPIPGAIEAIRDVAASGAKIGIISSAVYHPFLEWTLQRFGISKDLAFVMTSASTGIYKSDPEIYRLAMRTAESRPSRSIHVGDSEKWDVWCARRAGMRTVWFRNGNVDTLVDRPLEVEPDHVVTSMAEVAPWVLTELGNGR